MPTVAQLRKELKKRGLDTKGKKAVLEQRLADASAEAEPGLPPAPAPSSLGPPVSEPTGGEAEAREAEAPPAQQDASTTGPKEAPAAAKPSPAVVSVSATQAVVACEKTADASEASSGPAPKRPQKRPATDGPAQAAAASAPSAVPASSGFAAIAAPQNGNLDSQPSKADKLQARREKLRLLQGKMNEARKGNREKVREEEQSKHRGGSDNKRKHAEFVQRKVEAERERAERGEDLTKPYMYESAEAAEAKRKKQKKKDKNKASFGWEVFNQDNLYNAFKKRAASASSGVDKEDYSALKMNYGSSGGEFYPDANTMDYGHQSAAGRMTQTVPEQNITRMVNELEDAAARRSKFSRRRKHNEDRDVDSINERNAVYNRKIARAFDKYTVEIRQNLERGTALPS